MKKILFLLFVSFGFSFNIDASLSSVWRVYAIKNIRKSLISTSTDTLKRGVVRYFTINESKGALYKIQIRKKNSNKNRYFDVDIETSLKTLEESKLPDGSYRSNSQSLRVVDVIIRLPDDVRVFGDFDDLLSVLKPESGGKLFKSEWLSDSNAYELRYRTGNLNDMEYEILGVRINQMLQKAIELGL